MADLTLATADKVNVVTTAPYLPITAPAAEAITAGQPILFDANGKWIVADANAAADDAGFAIATRTVAAGEALTGCRFGIMDGWSNLPAYGAPVYVSDTAGALADAAGTATILVGHVIPVWGTTLGTAADKALLVECSGTGSAA
jgi:hypothetical protein